MSRLLDRLRLTLEELDGATYEVSPQVASQLRHRAAVLILLLPRGASPPTVSSDWLMEEQEEEEFDLLLTRRSLNLRHFPGNTAFPGGKLDPTDVSIVHTALREAYEEVGVRPEEVTLLGVLPPILTRYGHLTYGVVGFLNEANRLWTRPVNEMELDDVFRLPLHRFLSTRTVHFFRLPVAVAPVPVLYIGMIDNVKEEGQEDKFRETWGLTAVFAIVTAMLAYGRKPNFPEFYVNMGVSKQQVSLKESFSETNEFMASLMSASKSKL